MSITIERREPGLIHFAYDLGDRYGHATIMKVCDSWNVVGYEVDEYTDDENSELFDAICSAVESSNLPELIDAAPTDDAS